MFELKTFTETQETMSPWVVDEIISTSTTLLYGESEVGKSFLVAELAVALATGGSFLGRRVSKTYHPLIAYTDDNADQEYKRRLKLDDPFVSTDDMSNVRLPIMRSPGMWDEFHRVVIEGGFDFVVIDNLTQAIDGEINSDKTIRDFFEGVRKLVNSGIPVVVVGHSSEKSGPTGKSDRPMGSSAIVQSVRHRIFVKRSGDTLTLRFAGNHLKKFELKLKHVDHPDRWFEVTDETSAADVEQRKQIRDDSKLAKNIEMAEWVVANCQGLSYRKAGDALADKFGGSGRSMGESLRSRDLSGLVAKAEDDTWSRVTH